jgi:hypothetical protein
VSNILVQKGLLQLIAPPSTTSGPSTPTPQLHLLCLCSQLFKNKATLSAQKCVTDYCFDTFRAITQKETQKTSKKGKGAPHLIATILHHTLRHTGLEGKAQGVDFTLRYCFPRRTHGQY